MIVKIIVGILFIGIFASLTSALIALLRGDETGKMLKSLTIRIALSVLVLIILVVSRLFGFI